MLVRFSEEGEGAEAEEEDIVVRVRGVERSEKCWWEEKRKHQKTPSLYKNKTPSTHGKDESDCTAHQAQPIKHSPMKHVSSNTAITGQKIQNAFRQKQSNPKRID